MAQFVLQVPEIERKGLIEKTFELNAAWLEVALEDTEFSAQKGFSGPFDVKARQVVDDILVEGRFAAALDAPCARCGDAVTLALDGEFTQFFSNRGVAALPDELELTPEDLDRETFSGEAIELDTFVREFILLEVPMAPRCEGSCANDEINRILSAGEASQRTSPLAALGEIAKKMRDGEES